MKFLTKVGQKLKANAPEILVGVGIGGVIVSTVMACKASKNVDEIKEEHDISVKAIHERKTVGLSDATSGVPTEYTEAMARKDLTKTYLTTAGKIIKLYLPSAAVMTLSIGCIMGSHKILNKRNAALAAAYTSLDSCYKDYRANVIDKYGEDADKEMAHGIKANKETEDGEKTYKATEKTKTHEGYSALFDEMNPFWEDNAEINKMFLTNQEQYVNDLLDSRKTVVFLNEVLDALGFDRVPQGQVIGWKYDENQVHKIDFGMYNIKNQSKKDFLNGIEKSILLEFNVDGYVLNSIK